MKPLVSVIIPIYNVAPYIERCARSLLEQSMSNVEYIFVDDSSPDNSIEILCRTINEYPQRKPNVTILYNEKNRGLAATRFVGLAKATGDYVLHCDSDDWIEPEMIQEMYEAAIFENADMVCCEAIKERKDRKFRYRYDYDVETIENGLLSLNFSEIHVAIWNKLIRRELFLNHSIRNYEKINMGEDSALTVRLRYYSCKTIIIHKAFYHYNRENQNSMITQIKESSVKEKIALASRIEDFFREKDELKRFKHVVNYYKFESKQQYMRGSRDIRKWRAIYPECHRDIFRFKQLTLLGRIKWWICAYLPI